MFDGCVSSKAACIELARAKFCGPALGRRGYAWPWVICGGELGLPLYCSHLHSRALSSSLSRRQHSSPPPPLPVLGFPPPSTGAFGRMLSSVCGGKVKDPRLRLLPFLYLARYGFVPYLLAFCCGCVDFLETFSCAYTACSRFAW